MALTDIIGDFCKLPERHSGVGAEWCHCHHPSKFETWVGGDRVGDRADLFLPRAGSTRVARVIEVYLHETPDRRILRGAG